MSFTAYLSINQNIPLHMNPSPGVHRPERNRAESGSHSSEPERNTAPLPFQLRSAWATGWARGQGQVFASRHSFITCKMTTETEGISDS